MNTDKLLLELGCEELPSKYILKLSESLFANFINKMEESGVEVNDVEIFSTPRRLAISCNVAVNLPEQVVERLGPLLSIAVDSDGSLTPAGAGFAKSCGVDFSELLTTGVADKARLLFKSTIPAEPIDAYIFDWLQAAYQQIKGLKMMRWHTFGVEFPRPVHWVICKLGSKLIPGQFMHCDSQEFSYGHRFMHPDKVNLDDVANYSQALLAAKVIADPKIRQQTILSQMQALVAKDQEIIIESELLAEVNGLVEWPQALLCQFDEKYLALPEELLVEVMRVHQKCFPIKSKVTNRLLPYFITVSNLDSLDKARVAVGNQRVMTARLADAEFFFAQDCQYKLDIIAEKLDSVIFQDSLGTMLDKSLRVKSLAKNIASKVDGVNLADIAIIVDLMKADLCSETVQEFPSLHGVIGAELALKSGYSSLIATGIRQQVYPKSADDQLPTTKAAQIVAIADRLDSIVGFFSVNCAPTGDKDPYGLRRAAMAVVRIIVETKLSVDLVKMIEYSFQSYAGVIQADVAVVLSFILDRFKVWSLSNSNYSMVYFAVINDQDCLLVMVEKMQILVDFLKNQKSLCLVQANKRVANILKSQKNKGLVLGDCCFETDAEQNLFNQVVLIEKQLTHSKLVDIPHMLLSVVPALEQFFAECMVLVDDEKLKQQRLALLFQVHKLFNGFADFSKIVVSDLK